MNEHAEAPPERPAWREALLRRLLATLTPIVVAATAMGIVGTHGRNRATFAILLPVIGLQIVAALSPHWSYRVRAAMLIAPLPVAAVLTYSLTGFKGNASVVSACAVVLTGLLFGRREMILLLGALLLVPITVGTAMVTGHLRIDESLDLSTYHVLPWVRTTFVGFATWTLLGLAITFVVQRIEGELEKTREALAELRAEQTRRVKAEAERRMAEESALQAQKMELVGRVAAGVAHDFNNVLGVLGGWTELSLGEGATRDDRAQGREAIEASLLQGKALTRQLMALSRRDARFVSRLCLERVVRSGVSTLSRVMPPGIRVTFQQGESVHVDADETELQQVLFNLVLNAKDALSEGGNIEVTTGLVTLSEPISAVFGNVPAGSWAKLAVKDTGSGIDPAVCQQIFELFFTTKPIGLGTGLGLATVRRIAESSGGAITLDSAPGKGSTFALYLPTLAT